MPGTIIATELFLAGVISSGAAYAATAFAVNLVASYAISRIFTPNDPLLQDSGARVQLPPSTRNKIPIVYGTAWVRPTITDAKISTDQTTMWYVCVLSETPNATTNAIGDIYWGDKLLNFDAVDQTKVISWTDTDGTTSTTPDGYINIYKYGGSSSTPLNTGLTAIQVLQDSAILPANQWTATDRMDRLTFLVVKVVYNAEKGITGLDNLNCRVTCPITKPGDVIQDYLTNAQYGCDIPLGQVDTFSLLNLNLYSDATVNFGSTTQARYRFNGVLDTGRDCFSNLLTLGENCDSWIQWNEATAKWGVVVNKAYDQSPNPVAFSTLFSITDNNILGAIQFTPTDLSSSYNRYEVRYYETTAQDKEFREYGELNTNLLNPNEPDNPLSMDLVLVNNNLQSGYIATRRMLQSREDLVITLNVDYSGIQIDAGDVVRVTNSKFGWVDKLFRVAQVVEGRDTEGILSVQLTLNEYNSSVYSDIALTVFTPASNSGVTNPNNTVTPTSPFVSVSQPTQAVPYFVITSTAPVGTYTQYQLWISSTTATDPYVELATYTGSYPTATVSASTITGVPIGQYRFKVRYRTQTGIWSNLSAASSLTLDWQPNPNAATYDLGFTNSLSGLTNIIGIARDDNNWVITTHSGGTTRIYSSPDRTTWTQRVAPAAIINQAQPFVSSNGSNLAISAYNYSSAGSTDGITWTGNNLAPVINTIHKPVWNGTWYFSTGADFVTFDNAFARTTNGTTWTNLTGNVRASTWGFSFIYTIGARPTGQIVVLGGTEFGGGAVSMLSSDNGITWTNYSTSLGSTLFGANTPTSVVWSPTLNLWCVVGNGGACATSADGINWTFQGSYSSSAGGNMAITGKHTIVWHPGTSRFVAVAGNGECAVSVDGINWQEESSINLPSGGGMSSSAIADMIVDQVSGKIIIIDLAGRIAVSA